jgi:hypothetical protein
VRIRKSVPTRDQYFEGVIAELQALRTEEHRLIHLYPRLRRRPKLRMRFLMDLANLRVRADRLNSSLDPITQLQDSDAAQTVAAQVEQLCA